MIVRLAFFVAASIAAYALQQITTKTLKKNEEEDKQDLTCFSTKEEEEEEEEELKEEVKLINSIINPSPTTQYDFEDNLLPEVESIDFPLPTTDKYEQDRIYEHEVFYDANELDRLQNLVRELEEREVKLEGELLEYYQLKEQESNVAELRKQLNAKTLEIDTLNITINLLQAERKKLQEEVSQGVAARKELEMARKKLKDFQKQVQMEANQTKGHLLLLKQQVSGLQAKEKEALEKDAEVEKKMKDVREMEVEVMELKRKNKELHYEKRELVVKLDAAKANVKMLSNMTETEMVAKVREELNSLRHTNEDLVKQVEGLQMNRFSEVEELVYLRWVNACLRFELRNYQNLSGKVSARDLNKSLSPRSQERAKQLMLEYAGSEREGVGDTDMECNFDNTFMDSEDFDSASMVSVTSRFSSLSKKTSLIQKIKRWGKNRDDYSPFSSPTRSTASQKPKGPLEALMIRNASDGVAITSFGTGDQDSEFNLNQDSANHVTSSFQVMSKSVEGVLDEKYPAYKDRHKLASEREIMIKEKAQQARTVKFGDPLKGNIGSSAKVALPPKLVLIKEKKPVITSEDSNDDGLNEVKSDSPVISKMQLTQVEKRAPRVPRPPPKPFSAGGPVSSPGPPTGPPRPLPPLLLPLGGPPRPPPPPGSLPKGSGDKVHRVPELVEFYQALMKREAKKDTSSVLISTVSDTRSNMIGEIENRSSFLMAVKADVETQGDFVLSLATEVRAASFAKVEDLVSFVNWLDEELSFLVDERAVLKHFDWPEGKADALREASFEYKDLMKLAKQVSTFTDDPNLPCEVALKKMYTLLEKVEQSVYALLRTRDMAVSRYKEFGIPVEWLLDSGVVGKIKLSSVQLARKYMTRVASELDAMTEPEKEPNKEFLILQGIRFAFRVHQFAGGFNAESMKAFEELRGRTHTQSTDETKAET